MTVTNRFTQILQRKVFMPAQRQWLSEVSLCTPKVEKHPLTYKVRVVNPDGSSFFTRYHLPVGVIQLPIDPKSLSAEQLKARQRRLRNEKKIEIKEYKEDVKFDRRSMAKLLRQK